MPPKAKSKLRRVLVLSVIAMFAIMAFIAVSPIFYDGEELHVSPTRARIAAISAAVQVYDIRFGRYPKSLEVLTQPMGDYQPNIKPDMLIDSFGTPFRYTLTDDYFEIRSAGPDKVFDTEDDITNTRD